MRWTSKPPYIPPNIGTKRVRTFFAWSPVTIGQDNRLFETVTVEEEYAAFLPGLGGEVWIKVRFL